MSTPDASRWRTHRAVFAAALACLLASSAWAASQPRAAVPRLGQSLSSGDLAKLPPSIFPDGRSLPIGRGTAREGAAIYDAQCAACHGAKGVGGSGGHLIGDGAITGPDPDPATNTYWPHATTLFDFTRRAMPMTAPGSLTADETYAVTAYLLHLGGIIGADAELNERTLPQVRMPNRDGFDWIDVPGQRRR